MQQAAGDRPAGNIRGTRSVVMARNGVIATSQPLATAAGLRVLQSGGNAIDAAVTAAAVLSVVEPTMNGPGGDLFAMPSELRLVGDDRKHHGADGEDAPSADSKQRAAVEFILFGQQSTQLASLVGLGGAGRFVGRLSHMMRNPNESLGKINRNWATIRNPGRLRGEEKAL